MKRALTCACVAAFFFSGNAFAADSEIEGLKTRMNALQERIRQLEEKEKDATMRPAAKSETAAAPAKAVRGATGENVGNPSISVIGNFTGRNVRGSGGVHSSSFLPLSEAEFVFGANIDPHARLDVTVTAADGGMVVEEGFITAYLPFGFNALAGRKFLPVGRANAVHPHALIYADRPNGLVNLFGPEIFIGDGLLLERPFFIGDSAETVTFGFFGTQNDVAFDPTGTRRYAALARLSGVWDTGDNATLELGGTYVQGNNGIAAAPSKTKIAAGHLAWKYLDIDHFGLNIEGEWLRRWQQQGPAAATLATDGSYLLADVGLNQHWHLFGRFDHSRERDIATRNLNIENAWSLGAVWKVSEFQSLTLQHKQTRGALNQVAADLGIAAGSRANAWLFRWVVAIGPHGAHPY